MPKGAHVGHSSQLAGSTRRWLWSSQSRVGLRERRGLASPMLGGQILAVQEFHHEIHPLALAKQVHQLWKVPANLRRQSAALATIAATEDVLPLAQSADGQ